MSDARAVRPSARTSRVVVALAAVPKAPTTSGTTLVARSHRLEEPLLRPPGDKRAAQPSPLGRLPAIGLPS